MVTVIAIRDLCICYAFNWRGSYVLGTFAGEQDAVKAAKTERAERGGKYGFVFYENGAELGILEFGSVAEFVKYPTYL